MSRKASFPLYRVGGRALPLRKSAALRERKAHFFVSVDATMSGDTSILPLNPLRRIFPSVIGASVFTLSATVDRNEPDEAALRTA